MKTKQSCSKVKIILPCIITAVITCAATWAITKYIITKQDMSDIQTVCQNNASPDINGCCPGEEYTDMGDEGFNCCPIAGGDCFPPIKP